MKALRQVVIATLATGVLGLLLKFIIEKITHDDIEALFGNLSMIGTALIVVGTLIIYTERVMNRKPTANKPDPTDKDSLLIGLSQGLCLPFRGLSRSGVTISTALLQGVNKSASEGFSFALAVVLTPPVVAKEIHRFWKQEHIVGSAPVHLAEALLPCLLGMVFSFIAGLIALKFLSRWLEQGRWGYFGYYCYAVAAIAFVMFFQGM